MKINKKFNQLSKSEYKHYIDNHKKYTDFNTLGLYRSIVENQKLNLEDKIEIRDYANETFHKTFNFYQLKDPKTYFELVTLGKELDKPQEYQLWNNIRTNQEKILKEKRIKHRNFGNYAKHDCGYEDCPLDGLMVRQGSWLAMGHMHFDSDKRRYGGEVKSVRHKKDQRSYKQMINQELEHIQILPKTEVNQYSELSEQTQAFLNQYIDEEFGHVPIVKDTEWATPDWTIIYYIDDAIASFYNIVISEVKVDDLIYRVGGINNVMTPKPFRGKGYATKVLQDSEQLIFDELNCDIGLLLCADALIPFYERLNWYAVDCPVFFKQSSGTKKWTAKTMLLSQNEKLNPQSINLLGLPW